MHIEMEMDIVSALITTMEIDETLSMIFPYIASPIPMEVGAPQDARRAQDLGLLIVQHAW